MEAAAQRLVKEVWALGGGRRDAYRDFNALTLRIVTDALFGSDLPASAAAEVTGALPFFLFISYISILSA